MAPRVRNEIVHQRPRGFLEELVLPGLQALAVRARSADPCCGRYRVHATGESASPSRGEPLTADEKTRENWCWLERSPTLYPSEPTGAVRTTARRTRDFISSSDREERRDEGFCCRPEVR